MMITIKKILQTSIYLMLLNCTHKNNYVEAENALDAGRFFIEACLQGDFVKSRFYALPTNLNKITIDSLKTYYYQQNESDRMLYKKSSINIVSIIEDTLRNETIIQYNNSVDKMPQKIKVVRQEKKWLITF